MEVVGVSKPRTSGSYVTKAGKKAYRGKRKHWYVYFYDEGRFRKKQISRVQVPYYGSLIRRRKSYLCNACGAKFRSVADKCPNCGARARKAPHLRGVRTTKWVNRPMTGLDTLPNLEDDAAGLHST